MEVVGAGALLLLCVLFILFFSSSKMYKEKNQLPPGPSPSFFLGNILQKDVLPLSKCYRKLLEKYGPIFTVWMGGKPLVVLCGYEVVKDALLSHAEEFGGRPIFPIHDRLCKGQGFLGTRNATKWKELRRFSLSTLREFGMGRKTMSERVQEEALFLVKEMDATQGKPFDPKRSITSALSNVLCSVLYGKRFDYEDENFQKKMCIVDERLHFMRGFMGIVYSAMPQIMECLPGQHFKSFADTETLCDFIRETVESHRQTLDPQNPRDYIDCFLMRMEKEQNSPENFYSTEDLVMSVFTLFFASSTAPRDALLFSLLVMVKFPHIQEKVQQEIDDVVCANRVPGMEDRVRLPFTNAVIHETQRYQIFSTEIFPREMTCHIEFRGYNFPKGTSVLPLYTSVHYDPLQWETPEEFNPDHFLNEKGQFRKRDAFMPFSVGKRYCLGEALARVELFLFFSILLQKFTFQLVGDVKNMDVWSLYMAYKTSKQHPQIQAIRRSV
ncbi:cytochrome P450 2C20-like [Elgaria multicarinata webbii]|uniref:cytochrome P450 2C20-like n=1 Tax=Elgaria multicarinata webbii TaxID=159646 RepID=UPI002FCD1052